MRMKAAVCYGIHQPLVIEEVELDPPKAHEVLVKLSASGVCHSDVSMWNGHLPRDFPIVLGHEGAGIVQEVGPDVGNVKPGDHVVLTYLPSCGRCRWCHIGQPTLCDLGQYLRSGKMLDGTTRLHRASDGMDLYNLLFVSTFAEYSVVPDASLVKVPEYLPLERLCLLGCGFTTGFGAATNTIRIQPGETVTIVGCGGLGIAALQGAKLSGAGKIIAVDVHEEKLSLAKQFGATHTIQSRGDPQEVVKEIMEITWGVGTDYSIELVGGDQTDDTMRVAFKAIRKGGTMVMVGAADHKKKSIPIDPYTLTLWRKRIVGVLFGDAQFQSDIPKYIGLYESRQIDLDRMVTKEIRLEQINEAFEDILAGSRVIRSVVRY
jgi:S-(hydroxymethyl)glutathione dehydrogenase/alcohol dehydrogenase